MRIAFAVILLASSLAACGSGGGSSGPEPAEATEAGLLATARTAAETFADAPTDAYAYLSEACQGSITPADWEGQMLLASSMMESFYGFTLDETTVENVEVVSFEGESGSVLVTASGPDGEPVNGTAVPWLSEDGAWVTDECETIGSEFPD